MGMPLDLIWLVIPAYVVLQIIVLVRSSRSSRMTAAVPLFIMVPVFIHATAGLTQESHLWPLPMLFTSPIALVYVVVIVLRSRGNGPVAGFSPQNSWGSSSRHPNPVDAHARTIPQTTDYATRTQVRRTEISRGTGSSKRRLHDWDCC